jgi:hypothetical protein
MRVRLSPIACQSIVLAICLGMPMPLIASLANHAGATDPIAAAASQPAISTAEVGQPVASLGSRAANFDPRVMTTGSIVGW